MKPITLLLAFFAAALFACPLLAQTVLPIPPDAGTPTAPAADVADTQPTLPAPPRPPERPKAKPREVKAKAVCPCRDYEGNPFCPCSTGDPWRPYGLCCGSPNCMNCANAATKAPLVCDPSGCAVGGCANGVCVSGSCRRQSAAYAPRRTFFSRPRFFLRGRFR